MFLTKMVIKIRIIFFAIFLMSNFKVLNFSESWKIIDFWIVKFFMANKYVCLNDVEKRIFAT